MPRFSLKMLLAFELLFFGFGFSQTPPSEQLRTNLYAINADGTVSLNDGDLILYSTLYSNIVDGSDARKITNPAENIGMVRGATTLAIEKRHIIESSDTVFFKIWQMQKKDYKLEFVTDRLDHPGMFAILEDKWLNTSSFINLNGTTVTTFSVTNDAASFSTDRFRIVFSYIAASALPVSFTSLAASEKNNGISVQWKIENESGIKLYEVQRSSNGQVFSTKASLKANTDNKNISYETFDASPFSGDNFYRIKSVNVSGEIQYSKIIKIHRGISLQQISIYPNPVVNGVINLQLTGATKGEYKMSVINKQGQIILSKKFQHEEGNSTQTIQLNNNIKGNYLLEIVTPENKKITSHILFQ